MHRIAIRWLLFTLLTFTFTTSADWVGTSINRIFLDPASVPVAANGYQNTDVLSFIMETTPRDTGSTVGTASWAIAYVPDGVEVIAAELVLPAADGSFQKIPARDVGAMAEDCGKRGCRFPTGTAPTPTDDAPLGPCQQDTGIFYSTDPRTALAPGVAITPTGPGAQMVYNTWDLQQINAFGIAAALSGNQGKGNTPAVDIGGTFFGTGSPVAGPDAFCRKDYNPACDAGSSAFNNDAVCDGPWKRIAYPNSKKGGVAGGGTIVPPTTGGVVLVNNSVADNSGWTLGTATPLPSPGTNAVRFVHGIRRLGDLEYTRITFRIVDAAVFVQSIYSAQDFCMDATGSDTDKLNRGAQDNPWRYYEGNPHTCLQGNADGVLSKQARFVNGLPSGGANLTPDDIIGFELNFTNTSGGDLTAVVFSDAPGTNLTLVAAGTTGCPYSSYDGKVNGVLGGITFNTLGPPATWNALATLSAGSTATVFMCGKVDSLAAFKAQVRNVGKLNYSKSGVPQPELTSPTLGTVSSLVAGPVFLDTNSDGIFTTGEVGIDGVTIRLWDDSTGTAVGVLDAGDTLLRTTVTAPDGTYSFAGFFGDLLVQETDPTGFDSTGDIDTVKAACASPPPGNTCNAIGRIVITNSGVSVGNDFLDEDPLGIVPVELVSFTIE